MSKRFYFSGHTYTIVNRAKTWSAAKTYAKKNKAHLAIISSAGENAAIFNQLKSVYGPGWTSAPDGGGADYTWIGASDIAKEGVWRWTDGKLMSKGYTNWGAGGGTVEPDDWNGQDAGAIGMNKWPQPDGGIGVAGEWNDVDKGNKLYFVMETDYLRGTSKRNTIKGTSKKDTIRGLGGNDRLFGRNGNDVIEGGTGNDSLKGGKGRDKIRGGSGRDLIMGEAGSDRLSGGSSADRFRWTNITHGRDVVTDFNSKQKDKLQFSSKAFGKLPKGKLAAKYFVASKKGVALDKNDRFVYNTVSRKLYFDKDGKGGAGAKLIATLPKGTKLKNTDIVIV